MAYRIVDVRLRNSVGKPNNAMEAQQFNRRDLMNLVDLVAHNAARRPVGHTYLMTSDIAWQFPGCAPKENIRLWRDRSGLAAYAWFQPPDGIRFDARHDIEKSDDLLAEAMDWALARRAQFPPSYPFYIGLRSMQEWADAIRNPAREKPSGHRYLVSSSLETDVPRMELLHQHGFETTRHYEPILTCDLRTLRIPDLPEPFALRQVNQADFEARVELHSAAWAPASGFNMDQYLEVRAMTEVFDPDLDIVAVAEDGIFASYTIAWKDPVSLIGSFEPFGTRPEFRGTGVSRAVIGEGFRRLIQKGMTHARIYTAGFNHQAKSLYASCGFRQVDVNRTLLKKL